MTLPTPPAPRIPYDEDGSVLIVSRNSGLNRLPQQAHQRAVRALNSDAGQGLLLLDSWWTFGGSDPYYSKNYISIVFPRPMDIRGYALSALTVFSYSYGIGGTLQATMYSNHTVQVQTSPDSTNGIDGTWTTRSTKDELDVHLGRREYRTTAFGGGDKQYQDLFAVSPEGGEGDVRFFSDNIFAAYYWLPADTYRLLSSSDGPLGVGFSDDIVLSGVRAVRFYFPRRPVAIDKWRADAPSQGTIMNLHLYGQPSSDTGDRLTFKNVAGSALFDWHWGDVDVAAEEVRSFTVANLSATDTASNVSVSAEQETPEAVSSLNSIAFSLDEVTWVPRVRIGDIAPGDLSQEIFVRLSPKDTDVGLRSVIVKAHAGRWL